MSTAPILKWVGGKRQLLDRITQYLPPLDDITTYYEPFVGGGALLFHLMPGKACINDINPELINVYTVVREDVDALIAELRRFENTADMYYAVRGWDRDRERYAALSPVQRAARIIYLNKTCYNGLYRVNASGEYNSPFGRYKNPDIVNEERLRSVSEYFNKANVRMLNGSYADALKGIRKGSFVYLDPPYDPISETAAFTSYAKDGFSRQDQIDLRKTCDRLDSKGIRFMLSNSATPFILEQYKDYDITIVKARRAINSNGSKRGAVDEVIVRNYS